MSGGQPLGHQFDQHGKFVVGGEGHTCHVHGEGHEDEDEAVLFWAAGRGERFPVIDAVPLHVSAEGKACPELGDLSIWSVRLSANAHLPLNVLVSSGTISAWKAPRASYCATCSSHALIHSVACGEAAASAYVEGVCTSCPL
jgi:hypothetical protein